MQRPGHNKIRGKRKKAVQNWTTKVFPEKRGVGHFCRPGNAKGGKDKIQGS